METGAIIFLSIMAVALHRNFQMLRLCIYKKRPRWGRFVIPGGWGGIPSHDAYASAAGQP